jgi:hypothetical protein
MQPHLEGTVNPITRCLTIALILAAPGLAAELPADATGTRPGEGQGPTEVSVGAMVVDVSRVDGADQSFTADFYLMSSWRDPRLAGIFETTRRVARDDIWHPRTQILNRRNLDTTFPANVEVAPDGVVLVRERYFGTFSSPMVLHDFPLDRQRFSIHLVTPGFAPEEVVLRTAPGFDVDLAREAGFSIADWSFGPISASEQSLTVDPGGRTITGYVLSFEGRRHLGHWIGKAFVSVAIIIAMSWVVFWLDAKYVPARVSVSVTSMLTLVAYRFLLGGDLPKLAYLTRMDYFLIGSTLLVLLTLVQVVATTALVDRDRGSRAAAVNRVSRWVFPLAFVGLTVGIFWLA